MVAVNVDFNETSQQVLFCDIELRNNRQLFLQFCSGVVAILSADVVAILSADVVAILSADVVAILSADVVAILSAGVRWC